MVRVWGRREMWGGNTRSLFDHAHHHVRQNKLLASHDDSHRNHALLEVFYIRSTWGRNDTKEEI